MNRKWWVVIAAVAVLVAGAYGWRSLHPARQGAALISGNGRIEATDFDVAAKTGGRVLDVLVKEGEFVKAGQPLAHMQVDLLQAQLDEAQARQRQAATAVDSANAQVAVRESDLAALRATITQRESELDLARRRLARSETLAKDGAASQQQLDDDRAKVKGADAALLAAKAQVTAAQSAITAARTQVAGAKAEVDAAAATVARIQADIKDSTLVAPRDGRVQYQVARTGEVVGGGGKVLNLVDLTDVYMTFFVPEVTAGQIGLGTEVHIVLDAAKQYVIPAKVSFVADTAQFTPKTVETASERQKLMFRVKARIDPALLQKHIQHVKTGLPGVAWVKVDPDAAWPANLAVNVPN